MSTPGLAEVGMSLIMVAIAWLASRWRHLPVGKEMTFGVLRAFVQLIAVGYALHFIFDLQSPWLILLALFVMITVGAHAAAERSKDFKGAFVFNFVSILIGFMITLATMLLFDIISWQARYVIPLSGMIIGNSMNASALAIDRLCSDLRGNRAEVETALSLGRSWRAASQRFQRSAAIAGMTSILNFMKTVGIVALPGAMTGMILAGAEPLDAVLLQVIVAYMLLSSTTITSVVAVEMTARRFFTPAHQLRWDV